MRTTVDVDMTALDAAKQVLGTEKLSETVNAALRKVSRQQQLKDFDIVRDFPMVGTAEQFDRSRDPACRRPEGPLD